MPPHSRPPETPPDPLAQLAPWIGRALEIGGGVLPALRALADAMPAGPRRDSWLEVCAAIAAGDDRRAAAGVVRDPELWTPLLAAAGPDATTGDGSSEVAFLGRAIDATSRVAAAGGWWRPAIYPAFVTIVAIGVTCFLAAIVIPTFKEIFHDFGMRLPAITLAFITLSDAINAGWWAFLAAVTAAALAWLTADRWWPAWLALPGRRLAASGLLARSAADLLDAGVPQPEAIRLAAVVCGRGGASVPPAAGDMLPSWTTAAVRHAVGVPMAPTSRARLLRGIADGHDQRLGTARSWLGWCLGPLAIFVTGLVVMLLVLALFLPLIKLVSDLS